MLTHNNVDRSAEVQTSPAPFIYGSTCKLGGITLPSNSFISLKLYVEDFNRVPYRIHSLHPDGKLYFCDATGQPRLYWPTFKTSLAVREDDEEHPYISSLLFNMNRVVGGHVCCTRAAMDLIRGVFSGITAPLYVEADAFVCIPQCHIAMMSGQGRSIGIISGGTTNFMTSDVTIQPDEDPNDNSGVVTGITGSTVNISLSTAIDSLQADARANHLCTVQVQGYTNAFNCIDKSIIIKAGGTSNLRVVQDGDKIILRGVLNA